MAHDSVYATTTTTTTGASGREEDGEAGQGNETEEPVVKKRRTASRKGSKGKGRRGGGGRKDADQGSEGDQVLRADVEQQVDRRTQQNAVAGHRVNQREYISWVSVCTGKQPVRFPNNKLSMRRRRLIE